ncbi:hypothetical protein DITRI_Ditri06bG0148000 [Diplodiscus trichospermus]
MAEEIIKRPQLASLVNQKNSKGDTPLHVAARFGSLSTAQILIDCANSLSREIEAGERLLRMVNKEKNTTLHDASRNGHFQIAELLIREDRELALLTNDVRESALFIAVDKNHFNIARIILEIAPVFSWEDFVEYLTIKCRSTLSETDENEWTPLHYAVHFGAVYICKQFLAFIDSSTAYIRDKEGMSVIHIAAREGEVIILEMLAYRFPEMWDLQDDKGQTVLHLAVARGKLDSVKFILATHLSHNGLINQQDNEGNTALHLASIQGNRAKIFDLLIKDSRVDKTATNMDGLPVVDILLLKGSDNIWQKINKNGRKTRSIQTRNINQPQQSERREPASDTEVEGQRQFPIGTAESIGPKEPSYDQLRNICGTKFLVTTLIATVSFAAGFTMPGGYKSDGPDEGMAILSKKSAFRVLVIANALAFCFSSTSMFLQFRK